MVYHCGVMLAFLNRLFRVKGDFGQGVQSDVAVYVTGDHRMNMNRGLGFADAVPKIKSQGRR